VSLRCRPNKVRRHKYQRCASRRTSAIRNIGGRKEGTQGGRRARRSRLRRISPSRDPRLRWSYRPRTDGSESRIVRRCGVHLEGVNWSRGISFYYDGQRGGRGKEESRPPSGGFARVRHERLSANRRPRSSFPGFLRVCTRALCYSPLPPPPPPAPRHSPLAVSAARPLARLPVRPSVLPRAAPLPHPRAFTALFPLAVRSTWMLRTSRDTAAPSPACHGKPYTEAYHSLSLSPSPSLLYVPRRNLVRSRAQWFSAFGESRGDQGDASLAAASGVRNYAKRDSEIRATRLRRP